MSPKTLSFKAAAIKILKAHGEPLHSKEITRRALDLSLLNTSGKTPEETLNARIAVSIKNEGSKSPFVRTAPSTFGLRAWLKDGEITPYDPQEDGVQVRVPDFPTYASLRLLLPLWEGVARSLVTGIHGSLSQMTRTRAESLDWTDPEAWIPARLEGAAQALALLTWRQTKGVVNPRYQLGHWLLASGYGLVREGADGRISLTATGRDFIDHSQGQTTRDLDEGEGVLEILRLVAEGGPLSSGELKTEWRGYLGRVSRIRSESYARSALLARLNNLRDRGLVERAGHRYVATEAGLQWLKGAGSVHAADIEPEEADLFKIINDQRTKVREELLSLLSEMDPIGFEHVIAQLLEAIGYTDVEVTAPSGDKGVDVVGTIKLGISTVREVVQVKRMRANIRRPALDQLRGSLHRFRAVRGTLITTGNFSAGTRDAAFEIGAAPITLINGETLVELLMEKEIGARKRPVVLWEVDTSAFEEG